LDEKKSKYGSLAQHNGFGLTYLHNFVEANRRYNKVEQLLKNNAINIILIFSPYFLLVSDND
jgi:hypothetical protein